MYKTVTYLTYEILKLKKVQTASLKDWAWIKAGKQSLKDGKVYFVEITRSTVQITTDEPTSGNWYRITGLHIEKFIPTFAVKA